VPCCVFQKNLFPIRCCGLGFSNLLRIKLCNRVALPMAHAVGILREAANRAHVRLVWSVELEGPDAAFEQRASRSVASA